MVVVVGAWYDQGMGGSARTLVIDDGSLTGLLACAAASEQWEIGKNAGGCPIIWPDASHGNTEAIQSAVLRHAELYGLEVSSAPSQASTDPDAPAGLAESVMLLGALSVATAEGCDRVLWPAQGSGGGGGGGDELDVGGLARMIDKSVLVARLASIDSDATQIDTPYFDLTDRQVAELALDMGVPIDACWWWARADEIVEDSQSGEVREAQRNRWMAALREAGWESVAAGDASGN